MVEQFYNMQLPGSALGSLLKSSLGIFITRLQDYKSTFKSLGEIECGQKDHTKYMISRSFEMNAKKINTNLFGLFPFTCTKCVCLCLYNINLNVNPGNPVLNSIFLLYKNPGNPVLNSIFLLYKN